MSFSLEEAAEEKTNWVFFHFSQNNLSEAGTYLRRNDAAIQ